MITRHSTVKCIMLPGFGPIGAEIRLSAHAVPPEDVDVPPAGRNLSSSAPELLAAQAHGVLHAAVTQRGGGTSRSVGKAALGRGKGTGGGKGLEAAPSALELAVPTPGVPPSCRAGNHSRSSAFSDASTGQRPSPRPRQGWQGPEKGQGRKGRQKRSSKPK